MEIWVGVDRSHQQTHGNQAERRMHRIVGDDEKKARTAYKDYVDKSEQGYGRVGHEQVTLLHDGMVVESYTWVPKAK